MQQEVLKEKDLEFVLREKPKLKCSDCGKYYSHIERCKDRKNRCKNCKKKIPTNIFYNPNWKNKEYVGIRNFSTQEKSLIVHKHQKAGMTYDKAKRQVEVDLNVIKGIKPKKYEPECPSSNLEIKKGKSELNKELIKGLGLKEKR